MMALLPVRTFRNRLRLLVIASCLLSGMLVAAGLVLVLRHELRAQAQADFHAQARLVAEHSTAALAFNDPANAQQTLATLEDFSDVLAATLYSRTGDVFAQYVRARSAGAGSSPPNDDVYPVRQSVDLDSQPVGALEVHYDLNPLNDRLRQLTYLSAVLASLATLLALGLSYRLQKRLAQPLAELSQTAAQISNTGDYSLRASKFSQDEFGALTDTFNNMLGTIQQQNSQLQQTNQELRQKNMEMEQFTYTVSHDLKNPIVTIKGFVGMLKEDLAAGRAEDIDDSLSHITRAADRMSQLISELLELSRIGRVRHDPERLDVRPLVLDVVHDLRDKVAACKARVDVEPMPTATADPLRLRQVFENLLTNALKYGCTGADRTITVGGLARGGEVRYFVRDRGPGIERQYHQKIFGLFQRLTTSAEGTGIGLAIVARIAEVHGGRAWVESTPGNGATFWIALPDVADRQ